MVVLKPVQTITLTDKEEVMDIMLILTKIGEYLPAVAAIVASCAAVAVITPTKVDDKILGNLGTAVNFLLRIVNLIGLNFGKAVNKDD